MKADVAQGLSVSVLQDRLESLIHQWGEARKKTSISPSKARRRYSLEPSSVHSGQSKSIVTDTAFSAVARSKSDSTLPATDTSAPRVSLPTPNGSKPAEQRVSPAENNPRSPTDRFPQLPRPLPDPQHRPTLQTPRDNGSRSQRDSSVPRPGAQDSKKEFLLSPLVDGGAPPRSPHAALGLVQPKGTSPTATGQKPMQDNRSNASTPRSSRFEAAKPSEGGVKKDVILKRRPSRPRVPVEPTVGDSSDVLLGLPSDVSGSKAAQTPISVSGGNRGAGSRPYSNIEATATDAGYDSASTLTPPPIVERKGASNLRHFVPARQPVGSGRGGDTCSSCGCTRLRNGAKYCHNCGIPLS